MGVNSLPKTVTRQRRDCDLNPGPTAPESSTLTSRLPSTLHTTRSTQPCIPPGSLNRVPASAGGKSGNVTSAGWQVTLCDPIWHVSSRSGVATLRTAIHLLLTYLLPSDVMSHSLIEHGVCVQRSSIVPLVRTLIGLTYAHRTPVSSVFPRLGSRTVVRVENLR